MLIIAIVSLAVLTGFVYLLTSKKITPEQEAANLIKKAEAEGTKFEAFSEEELDKIEALVDKGAAVLKAKVVKL